MTTVLLIGVTVLAAGYLGYGFSPNFGVCVAAMLVAGIGFGLWSSVQGAILQGSVPNTMMATYVAGIALLTPIASLIGSQAGRRLVTTAQAAGHTPVSGYRMSYLAAAVAVLLGAALRLASRRSTSSQTRSAPRHGDRALIREGGPGPTRGQEGGLPQTAVAPSYPRNQARARVLKSTPTRG